jgi:hypothetical protein
MTKMTNELALPIKPELQKFVDSKEDAMPKTLARILTPLELEEIWIIHPTTNDPVVMSNLGAIAIYFRF